MVSDEYVVKIVLTRFDAPVCLVYPGGGLVCHILFPPVRNPLGNHVFLTLVMEVRAGRFEPHNPPDIVHGVRYMRLSPGLRRKRSCLP